MRVNRGTKEAPICGARGYATQVGGGGGWFKTRHNVTLRKNFGRELPSSWIGSSMMCF